MNQTTDHPGGAGGAPNKSGEIGSAARSCLVILIMIAAMLVLLCVALAVRWLA